MRIVINDYSGHPFQVQLSRELARRGHDLLHLHFSDFQTPKGDLELRADDPSSLAIEGVSLGVPFEKSTFVRRRRQEIAYGHEACRRLQSFRPDIVVGCNNPLDAQHVIQNWCGNASVPFVFWLQDLYSIAITEVLSRKFSLPGAFVGRHYQRLERRMLRASAAIVAISNDFLRQLQAWNIDTGKAVVIPNWAPLDALQVRPKVNPWSLRTGLSDQSLVVYTGTLGFKHNPQSLVHLAEVMSARVNTRVLVVSEGPGADYLTAEARARGLSNLVVLPFQPMAEYADVLGAADILISIIEPDAARFSVPSKVLSYLCSGRALVLSVPASNLAAQTVTACKAGISVEPHDQQAFAAAITRLLDDPDERAAAGRAARRYAEQTFDIARIADRFEAIFDRVTGMTPIAVAAE
ncbi:glycosyltransferase family 4 protein [Pseudorhodoplanes sp.]|uniref:glycosyltransferase family 4 protein n=1 Tax=Pseudorhodoplanes sp. TaxID=1934341 RepID=UPI003D0EB588